MITASVATTKRKIFSESRPLGVDDAKIPQFYNILADEFGFSVDRLLAFIVVAHPAHSLTYFLELVAQFL